MEDIKNKILELLEGLHQEGYVAFKKYFTNNIDTNIGTIKKALTELRQEGKIEITYCVDEETGTLSGSGYILKKRY